MKLIELKFESKINSENLEIIKRKKSGGGEEEDANCCFLSLPGRFIQYRGIMKDDCRCSSSCIDQTAILSSPVPAFIIYRLCCLEFLHLLVIVAVRSFQRENMPMQTQKKLFRSDLFYFFIELDLITMIILFPLPRETRWK